MACFLVPAAEAVITTAAEAVLKKKEKEAEEKNENAAEEMAAGRVKFSEKLGWLNMMLWGGAILLLFEHVWHGEVVPWFPFLTAASSPESTGEMLKIFGGDSGTVDNCHPNDLGFYCMAAALEPVLKSVLRK